VKRIEAGNYLLVKPMQHCVWLSNSLWKRFLAKTEFDSVKLLHIAIFKETDKKNKNKNFLHNLMKLRKKKGK
jgi:hypothetical protein